MKTVEYVPLDKYTAKRSIAIFAAFAILFFVCSVGGASGGLLVAIVFIGWGAVIYVRRVHCPNAWGRIVQSLRVSAREKDEQFFKEEISKHIQTLARKRNSLVTKDDYGNVVYDKWVKEKEYYLSKLRYSSYTTPYYDGIDSFDQVYLLDDLINEYLLENEITVNTNIDDMTPVEYEEYCAGILAEQGWESRVTQGSGDQGVDVLAEKDGLTIAIQCKKYSSPVGNKAVQEVIAGRGYYGAHLGIVVTNNTYTPSARQLAKSQSILLLHHDDLYAIDDIIDN
ncbi:restriction endonuclease [Scandinavium sp. H11S7]|uniref:Restriction endonuclease n=1 Tax=Scandinavium hiltneri TaxID=2926519 RepID=A0ABT2E7R0_9ENTR|nr:restriction endonuclease [Scandinavium hiltneri]MCS2163909.1 restriction endonuclease [Scandinavium hiltneri]